ncbi:MAG TPA: peptidylprolyl isomerase [Tepidiformaceae bacterium]|nr:peptidylprolyl isomerase [Tepidiformaceae bacterium]
MPKRRKRREQQHLRQESARRKSYTMGGDSPSELYKPGFPMNILGNLKIFSIVGVVIAAIMIITMVLTRNNGNGAASGTATPTAAESTTATPSVSPTPNPRVFDKALQAIDASKYNYQATVKTSLGTFVIALDATDAPKTVNSFVFLSEKDFYNGLTFHRVVPGFVIQGGDPNGDGTGGPGYSTSDEPNKVRNTAGTISMAKTSGATNFGSQFFINLQDNPSLDFDTTATDKFYPFGKVTSGMDVVDAIGKVPTDAQGKPTTAVTIDSITIQQTPKDGGPTTDATIPPQPSPTPAPSGTPKAGATTPAATPTK